MPLDVHIVRDGVSWPRSAAAGFRQAVLALEDHLLGLQVDDATLNVTVKSADDAEGVVQAVLTVDSERLEANREDLDLASALTGALEGIQRLATPERLGGHGHAPHLGPDAPWEVLSERLVAIAQHLVLGAVEAGDLSPGAVDPQELANDVLVGALQDIPVEAASLRFLRRRLVHELEGWIRREQEEAADLRLDAPVEAPQHGTDDDDDVYDFDMPDEPVVRGRDVLDPDADLTES